jgi:hypothetical protein
MTGKADAQAPVQVLRALEVVAEYPENRCVHSVFFKKTNIFIFLF